MTSARVVTEIVAKMPARIGLLADLCEALRKAGVNIAAVSAYQRDGEGKFLLVTSDDAKAREALGRLGAEVTEKSVVAVQMPDEPGALENAARAMAEAGIDIEYVFGTAAPGATGPASTLIFKTSDDAKVPGLF